MGNVSSYGACINYAAFLTSLVILNAFVVKADLEKLPNCKEDPVDSKRYCVCL